MMKIFGIRLKFVYVIGLFTMVFLSGCGHNSVPKGFPEEEEFAEVLADVHLAEATINQLRMNNKRGNSVANNYYHYVLTKHHLTQKKFDTIVNWYLAHPELYQDVYERSIALLSERQAKWQREVKGVEEQEARERKEREARNIWKDKKNYFISLKDTFDRRIPFDITVDTIDAEGYRLSAFYQFLKGNRVQEPILEVMTLYKDSTMDTLSYQLKNTHNSTKAELMIGLDKDIPVIRMQGYLVQHDTMEELRARIKEVVFEFLPKPDTLELDSLDMDTIALREEAQ